MTENNQHKSKKHSFAIFRGAGKTPAVDWMIMATSFACLALAAAVWGALCFIGIKTALQNAPVAAGTNSSVAGKTEEEKAEEILQLYQAKGRRHLDLLGTAKIDTAADKRNAPAVATTTATSSAPSTSGGSAATSSTPAPRR